MPPPIPSKSGVILLAHGARDPRWAQPFLQVADRVRKAAPGLPVEVAYLEFLEPGLLEAAKRLAGNGATRIRIIPLFFGRGGHLRDDAPKMVAEVAAEFPAVAFDIAGAAVDAIAEFCLRSADLDVGHRSKPPP
jgi:sirohydrochlorin cobaltochelatase